MTSNAIIHPRAPQYAPSQALHPHSSTNPTTGRLGAPPRDPLRRDPPSFLPFWTQALPARALRYGYQI